MQAREIVSRSDLMKELHVHACSCIFAPKGLCCLHFVMQSTRANKYLIVLTINIGLSIFFHSKAAVVCGGTVQTPSTCIIRALCHE